MQNIKKDAFTLMEMIIVMAIIGFIMAIAVPRIMKYMKQSDVKKYELKLNEIKEALLSYKMGFDNFPSEQQGLKALTDQNNFKSKTGMDAPLNESNIVDQNGNPIGYHRPPNIKNKEKFKTFELLWIGDGSDDAPQAVAGQ